MKKLEHSRILITGGAGFIGSNLVEKFLAQDNEVVVLDNFSTGKRENLQPFAENKNFKLIEGDIRNITQCRDAVDGVDYVLHQAARGSVQRSVEDPMLTTSINIDGFVNMLFAAKEAKVKRFVYASSSSVYGDNPALPKMEDSIGNALSPYAVTKQVNELYARNFHDLYGIDTVGLRYFNVFGKRQNPAGAYAAVIPKFAEQLIKHQKPVINGDGSFSRDFTYIDNVLQANELAAATEDPAAVNEVYNISQGGRMTLLELFENIRTALSEYDPAIGSIEPLFGPERAGDIPHSQADISKACRLLGYQPQKDTKRALQTTMQYYWKKITAC